MRIGIISPNLVINNDDFNRMQEDPDFPWPFDSLAKKASLLFDKIYVTQDLDVTCTILGSDGSFEENPEALTLKYLADHDFILTPLQLGYSTAEQFIKANLKGTAARINRELMGIGNPGIGEEDEEYLIGQPEVSWMAAHDGWHPRANQKQRRGMSIPRQQQAYESLLLRRNAALLRQAGIADVSVVGRLFEHSHKVDRGSPVWKIILKEIPQLDTRASWQDVLNFRQEERTQHLTRSLRNWVRKTVTQDLTPAELEDEVRELVYEYENHLRIAHMSADKGILEFLITGAAEIVENVVKLRFAKIATLASAIRNRRVQLLKEEANAPGRELALISEVKKRF
jgi:hypothetical protein